MLSRFVRGMVVWSMLRAISRQYGKRHLTILSRACHYTLSSMLRGIVCSILRAMPACTYTLTAISRSRAMSPARGGGDGLVYGYLLDDAEAGSITERVLEREY